jgi:predicted house-cleaning noncanonical NTP pyrophosphatase (MazG superfamily)
MGSFQFDDLDTGDVGYCSVRQAQGAVGITLSLEHDGDIEVFMTLECAHELALLVAEAASAPEPTVDQSEAAVPQYNKLVRDRVPAILRAEGHSVVAEALPPDRLIAALRAKLDEEIAEYDAAADDDAAAAAAAELADLAEVIVALAARRGCDEAQLDELRAAKTAARGAFDLGMYLTSVD